MSMFSFPTELNTDEMTKSMQAMTDWTKTTEVTVAPLMVYPLGAAAAATAIGFGIAGQMTGLMMGAMQAAMQSQGAMLGAKPDLSWIIPTLAEDLAPDEPAAPVAAAKSADIVELKRAPAKAAEAVEAPVKAKVAAKAKPAVKQKPAAPAPAAKAGPANPAPSAKAAKPAATEAAVAVVEKLKSDADVAAAAVAEAPVAKPVSQADPAKALEPEDFRRPAEIEKPATPDDLKLISGVGPKLEQVLNGLGVWTFAQVAAWQPEEVAWVDDYLQFKGRIDRDGWIAQAAKLAKGGGAA